MNVHGHSWDFMVKTWIFMVLTQKCCALTTCKFIDFHVNQSLAINGNERFVWVGLILHLEINTQNENLKEGNIHFFLFIMFSFSGHNSLKTWMKAIKKLLMREHEPCHAKTDPQICIHRRFKLQPSLTQRGTYAALWRRIIYSNLLPTHAALPSWIMVNKGMDLVDTTLKWMLFPNEKFWIFLGL